MQRKSQIENQPNGNRVVTGQRDLGIAVKAPGARSPKIYFILGISTKMGSSVCCLGLVLARLGEERGACVGYGSDSGIVPNQQEQLPTTSRRELHSSSLCDILAEAWCN